jgi:hypothetical protein
MGYRYINPRRKNRRIIRKEQKSVIIIRDI